METKDILLNRSIDRSVAVTWSSIPLKSNGFHTQLCVHGRLQVHSDGQQFRVVHSDGQTYAYFLRKDVSCVVPYSGGVRIFVEVQP